MDTLGSTFLTVMDGKGTQESAVFSRQTDGASIRNIQAANYLSYGVGIMAWPPVNSTLPADVHDITVENVHRNPPGSSNGTAEAAFWFGQAGYYRRLKARNAAVTGMWTGARIKGSVIEDFELSSMPNVGLYCEHATENVTFRNFQIESVNNGVNIEWWYTDNTYATFMPQGCLAGKAGSHDLVFENFEITVTGPNAWGVYIDAGNYNVTIRNGKITGANGIAYPSVLANPNGKGGDLTIDWASIDLSGVTGTKQYKHSNAIG